MNLFQSLLQQRKDNHIEEIKRFQRVIQRLLDQDQYDECNEFTYQIHILNARIDEINFILNNLN